MQSIGVGIVGFGLSGSVFHAPFFSEGSGFHIAAIVSSRVAEAKRAFPSATVTETLSELLHIAQVSLVIVATPNHLHHEHAKQALMAGKHVVIEKPFVTSTAQGQELIALAKMQARVLAVYHNRRWDGDFLTIKDLLARGELGVLSHFESHFDRFRPSVDQRWKEQPQAGSGNFFDLGSHLLDQALVLFGQPRRVLADVTKQRCGALADDYFHVVMIYDCLRVIIHGGSLVAKPGPRFQLHGDRGSFVTYGLDPQESLLRAGLRPNEEAWRRALGGQSGVLTRIVDGVQVDHEISLLPGAYQAFYDQLHRAITIGAEPPVSGSEAMATISLIEQCKTQSASSQADWS